MADDGKIVCRGPCKEPHPPHLLYKGVCYGCHCDGQVPGWYQNAEEYVPAGKPWTHWNASERPPTGVELLDMGHIKPSQLDLPPGKVPRSRS